jgi:hypothetical protein
MRSIIILSLAACQLQAATVGPLDDHRMDWQHHAGSLNDGGLVPSTNGWTHYATVTLPGQGRADINTALANAPAFGIVRVAGSGYIDGNDGDVSIRFTRSNVRLIGQGAWLTQMVITNAGVQSVFGFNPSAWEVPPANQRNWTAGYAKGDTNITLSSVANLAVGKLLILTQTADGNDVQGIGDEGACDYCAGMLYTLPAQTNFVEQEQKIVQAINGSVVTVYPPLIATNWASVNNPQCHYFSAATLTNMWVEDVGFTNTTATVKYLFEAMNSVNYGIKKVWSKRGLLAHWKTLHTMSWTVESSLLEYTVANSTESYGIAPYNTSGGLVVDTGFNSVTGPWKGTSASGCVLAYSFNTNQIYANPSGSSSGTNWLVGSSSTHGPFCMYNLIEGCMLNEVYNDFIHGANGWNTTFRSRIWGWQFDRTVNTFAFVVERNNRYNQVFGNVLGLAGYHTSVEALYPAVVPSPDRSVYLAGYRDADHATSGGDAATVSTLSRSHNTDAVTSTNSGQVYGLGFGPADTLPASLLYTNGVLPRYMAGTLKSIGPDQLGRSVDYEDLQIPALLRWRDAKELGDMQVFFTDLPIPGVTVATNALKHGSAVRARAGSGGI